MNLFGHEPSFWIAVMGATAFKLFTSHHQSWRKTLVTIGAAVLAAWLGTDAVLDWTQWDAEVYKAPTAAIIALVGENIMRSIMTLSPEKAIQLYKDFRK